MKRTQTRPDSERGGRPWEHPYPESKPWTLEKYQRDVHTLEHTLAPMVPNKINTLALFTNLEAIKYPVMVTPKVRGVRCLTKADGRAVGSDLNDIPNHFIRENLLQYGMGGLDGVLTIEGELDKRAIVDQVMNVNAIPKFEYHVFDMWAMTHNDYDDRVADLARLLPMPRPHMIQIHSPATVYDTSGLCNYWNRCVDDGYEGVMIRQPDGQYVMHGHPSPLGGTYDLSMHTEGTGTILRAKGIYGDRLDAFVVKDKVGNEFDVAHGYTGAQRLFFWKTRKQHVGYDLTYRYNPGGIVPRNPVFIKTTAR